MNIYFLGMCFSMFVYIIIGMVVSKRVKSVDEYYVAGRRAPVFLISGSLIASYASTSMFMGDAAQCYDGAFSSLIILSTMQTAGYIIGAVFFGRYLRRSKVLTIPDFFEKRFCSTKIKKLAAITAIVTMTVYLLSIIQGICTLMNVVTDVDYKLCVILSLLVITFVTVLSGSSGVLITDTLMAVIFTSALVLATLAIAHNSGGWFEAVSKLSSNPETAQMLSWRGESGVLYSTGVENILWGFVYGIVWMSVCMVGPWQSSRYLMAKDEHTVVRSAFFASIGIFMLEFLAGMAAVMVNITNPGLKDSSYVLIWAAMNLMPKLLGVILLTGVLAAGISSATTFLSLVGASFANDVVRTKEEYKIGLGRIAMVIVSVVVMLIALFNPPSIFWITFLGGAIVASSWMPVALASIFSKRITKTGAYLGMLSGFLACFVVRLFSSLNGITLPVYLDPSVVGMGVNVIFMILGSVFTTVSDSEKKSRDAMFVIPDSEKNINEMKKTLKYTKNSVLIGAGFVVFMLIFWVVPYLCG